MKNLFIKTVVTLLLLSSSTISGTIKGRVIDSETKRPIVGATVLIESTDFGAISGLDGSFHIKNITNCDTVNIKISSLEYWGYIHKDLILKEDSNVSLDDIFLIRCQFNDMTIYVQEKFVFPKDSADYHNRLHHPTDCDGIILKQQNQKPILKSKKFYTTNDLFPKALSNYELASGYVSKMTTQIDKLYKMRFADWDYFVSIDENNIIEYVATIDSNFITSDNFKIGDTFKHVSGSIKPELMKHPNWGYSIILPSGWNAAFCIGESCTDSLPNQDSKIKWFFKN